MHAGRRAVVMSSIVLSVALLGDAMLYVVLPLRAPEVGVPVALVGILLSANRFIRLISNTAAGYLYQRFGGARPFIFATALAAITTAMYGLGTGFWVFLVARLLWGVCYSILRLGCQLAVLSAADAENRGRLFGLFHAISRTGALGGTSGGGLLSDLLGFRATSLLFAAITLVGMPLALLTKLPNTVEVSAKPLSAPAGRLPASLRPLNFATFASSFVGSGLVMATLSLLLQEKYGATVPVGSALIGVATVAGAILSVRWMSDLLLAPIFGSLSDRYGRQRLARISMAVPALCLVAVALSQHLMVTTVLSLALLISIGASNIALESAVGDIAVTGNRAAVMSRFSTWHDMGSAFGPAIGFAIGAQTGLTFAYVLGALLLIGSLLALPAKLSAPTKGQGVGV